ncbi:MAG: hypothetical protein AAF642_16445, partial [Pseudomonadota bacterium]
GVVKLWRFQSKAHLEAQEQRRAARKQARPNPAKAGPRKKKERQHGKRPHHGGGQRRPARREPDPDSPFAVLGALLPDKPKPKSKPRKRRPDPAKQDAPPAQSVAEPTVAADSTPDTPPSDSAPSDE